MKDLVFLKDKQALTTSLKVAEYFEKRHRDVVRAIEDSITQLEGVRKNAYTPPFIKTTYTHEQNGQKYPMYLLNRDGFMFVAMGFTGEKAAQLKWLFIQAFNAMEQRLLNWQNEQWQELRHSTKVGYKELSAAVKELYEWAVSHGCKANEKSFYMNFARLMNKTLGIESGARDTLAAWQLFEIEKLQFIAKTIIAGLIAQGADYHLPYRDCKSAFESYARLSYINQRLLQGVNH